MVKFDETALKCGATHYTTQRDGVTPQMYYKYEDIPFNDGTSKSVLVYLSYCNLWQGSSLTDLTILKEIK